MAINFPTTGLVANVTTYTYQGYTWLWNGATWQSVGTVQGLTGPQGNTGVQGIQGTRGLQGSQPGIATYIQPTQPSLSLGVQYFWWQNSGSNYTLWINDGGP